MMTKRPTVVMCWILQLCLWVLLVCDCQASPLATHGPQKCTRETMKVRREWGSLSKTQRKFYVDAVTCLQQLPSRIPTGLAPGAKSRYDDFTAIHINNSLIMHLDGYFLPWHRNFIFLYEQALIEECNYTGTLPYWNWPLWAADLEHSPLFDGSPHSLGSNGAYNASEANYTVGPGEYVPHGTGGGCILKGPFKNLVVPFKRFSFSDIFIFQGVIPSGSLDYAPHCLTRDLNDYVATRYTNQSSVDYLINVSPTIADFQNTMSAAPGDLSLGVHVGGHISAGLDLFDFFASPSDPAFHLHHAMIDLVWTLWQAKDPRKRQYALDGTQTTYNIPPSPNATLADVIGWGVLGQERALKELMSVADGPFCYRYEYEGCS